MAQKICVFRAALAVGICTVLLAAHPATVNAQTEACCSLDGTCTDLSPSECIAGGGLPGGAGTSCAGNPDICTQRPCCMGDLCAGFVAPQFCTEQGGTPQPLGSQCVPGSSCPEPDCLPAVDGKSCSAATCSIGGEVCQPQCTQVNLATGDFTVTSCDCRPNSDCHVVLPAVVVGGTPCNLPDNGSGTADYPPAGCSYTRTDGAMQIVTGLPAGTIVDIEPQLGSFANVVRTPGGTYGGEDDQFTAVLQLTMNGTGTLSGYQRVLSIPDVACLTYLSSRMPGKALQSFTSDLIQMQGQITGDSDFDLLKVTAGLDPESPPNFGTTTLVMQPDNTWAVESFFDILYTIEFTGRAGGPFEGMSGSTSGYVRVQTGLQLPTCAGGCAAPLASCNRTLTALPDGSVSVCCDCSGSFSPTCAPTPDGSACESVACSSPTDACVPVAFNYGTEGEVIITACECRPFSSCQMRIEGGTALCEGPCLDEISRECRQISTPVDLQCACACEQDSDCDDGNACTVDQCATYTGTCFYTPVICDDYSPCTTDVCNPATGQCEYLPTGCDDQIPCTRDICDPTTGQCRHELINCEDEDPCTIDTCNPADGVCLHTQINCDDTDACTTDTCDSSLGIALCVNTPISGCEQDAKWDQPPTEDQENIASNVWITESGVQAVKKSLADDFRSDGRPIHGVQWWGSYLQPAYAPYEYGGSGQAPTSIDGWLIGFHSPQRAGVGGAQPALGLYFAPAADVQITPVSLVSCDGHPVFSYQVRLADCCLLQSSPDVRVPTGDACRCPAKAAYFCERSCYWYELSIQAVVGVSWYLPLGTNCCERYFTYNTANADFWGWHTTSVGLGRHAALANSTAWGSNQSSTCPPLDVCGPLTQWLYGPWSLAAAVCEPPHQVNMSFALLTSELQVPPACPSLTMVSASSVKTHAFSGGSSPTAYAVNLPLNVPGGVEPRVSGPTKVVLTFSQPITATDGTLNIGDEVAATGATITNLAVAGAQLTLDLAAVINPSCVRIHIENGPEGMVSAAGDELEGSNDIYVRSLIGDITGDGSTNVFDLVEVRNVLNQAVNASNFRSDVTLDKTINVFDLVTIRNGLNLAISCP